MQHKLGIGLAVEGDADEVEEAKGVLQTAPMQALLAEMAAALDEHRTLNPDDDSATSSLLVRTDVLGVERFVAITIQMTDATPAMLEMQREAACVEDAGPWATE